MSLLIIHIGTGTILNASDDVILIDDTELTREENDALDAEDMTAIADKGVDIMKIIRYYMGEKK